jgi:tetratricopeptide (TPR) repeat protein
LALAQGPQITSIKVQADQLLKQGKTDRAISLYEKVLQEDRNFANAYYNLAVAYYLRGNFKKATENLESFLELKPEDTEGHYNLGSLQLRLGEFDEARKSFQAAEKCPSCPPGMSERINKALQVMKDLENETPEAQRLIAYLVSGSEKSLFAS